MSDTLTINVTDMSVGPQNSVNIAIINQPNPVSGFTASAEEIRQLIQISKYFIRDAGTGKPVNGETFYEFFPDLDPHSGGGGGGGGTTILSGDTDPSSSEGDDGDVYLKTTNSKLDGITTTAQQKYQFDYYMNANSVVVFECTLPAPGNSYDTQFGTRSGSVDHYIATAMNGTGGTLRVAFDSGHEQYVDIGSIVSYYNKRLVITLSRTQCKVECDGSTVYDVTLNGGSTTSSIKFGIGGLFNNNSGGVVTGTNTGMTIHSCKIYENDTLVAEYVPLLVGQLPCIKDTVTDAVYVPLGTGNPTPVYVQSTDDLIADSFLKVDDAWQPLVGSDIADVNTGSGGGGGTSDYNQLTGKPSINSVTLQNNVTSDDLGIQNCLYDDQTDELYTIVDGVRVVIQSDVKRQMLIPVMIDFDLPYGLIENGNSYGGAGSIETSYPYKAFDRDTTTYVGYVNENVTDGWLSYTFPTNKTYYVDHIDARFGNWAADNDVTATLYVVDENDNEIELDTVHVAGYARYSSGLFSFPVNRIIKKLKFVYGQKLYASTVMTYEVQAYGYMVL